MNGFFDEYTALYRGQVTNQHLVAHQACCLVVSCQPLLVTDKCAQAVAGKLVVVPSMVPHRLKLKTEAIFIFLDPHLPFSRCHRAINNRLAPDFEALQALLTPPADELPAFGAILRQLTPRLFQAPAPVDDRILRLTKYIWQHTHQKLPLPVLAGLANLSVSRLQHLFAAQVGMPITRYVHWQRLKVSYGHVLAGNTLTAAAYEGGFADGAHFSRTFRWMFGLTPSEILRKQQNCSSMPASGR